MRKCQGGHTCDVKNAWDGHQLVAYEVEPPRPRVRIAHLSARRGRHGTRVTVRLASGGTGGGRVLVTVRGPGRSTATAQVAAHSRVSVSLLLPSVKRSGRRLRVLALTRGGAAGRIASATVRAR